MKNVDKFLSQYHNKEKQADKSACLFPLFERSESLTHFVFSAISRNSPADQKNFPKSRRMIFLLRTVHLPCLRTNNLVHQHCTFQGSLFLSFPFTITSYPPPPPIPHTHTPAPFLTPSPPLTLPPPPNQGEPEPQQKLAQLF